MIGHGVIAHSATSGARCLIVMGSTLLNGCVVGEDELDAWVGGCATSMDLPGLCTEMGPAADLTAFRR